MRAGDQYGRALGVITPVASSTSSSAITATENASRRPRCFDIRVVPSPPFYITNSAWNRLTMTSASSTTMTSLTAMSVLRRGCGEGAGGEGWR